MALGGEGVLESSEEGGLVFDDEDAGILHFSIQTAVASLDCVAGRLTLKVLPEPGRLWTVTRPPWAYTMKSTMLRPRPQPWVSRAKR